MTPDNFALAVCTEDAKAISKASGIGGKTAARIILELKDKLAIDMGAATVAKSAGRAQVVMPISGNLTEATEALMVLGYDKNSVAGALAGLDPKADVGELIRAALKKLSR
jgi:Holliday junction DNA helicase RuvA